MERYYDIFMNKALWAIAALVIVLGGGFYLWTAYTSTPEKAAITVTSPAGGEGWESGSTQTVAWTSQGVPATDKISVTIRRIPPPPLQTEGQEFDPIVAINLPNTGRYAWTIANMYPSGTYVLGLSAYVSVPITSAVSAESAQFTISHPALSQDLYPLYGGVQWNAPEAETFTISTSTYSGASVASSPVMGTMNPGGIFTPFERYYDQKLKALGWSVANDLAAGGHVGGQTGYRKAGGVILTRFHIDYRVVPGNAPSECPCDVTLSLFSTN